MKRKLLFLSLSIAAVFLLSQVCMALDKPAPPRFGQTYDEIVAMAKKEGKVRIPSAFFNSNEAFQKAFGNKFKKKFGIEVEYTYIHGVDSRERILLELMGGHIEYDAVQIIPAVIPNYYEAGVVDGPFDWEGLFGVEKMWISPDNRMITAGATVFATIYNPDLVPEDKVPNTWEDMLDPWYKGKFIVVTRPQAYIGLYPHWGKDKTLDYCRKLAAQKPIWMSSYGQAYTAIAAGEFPMIIGANTTDYLQRMDRDPTQRLKMRIPKELPVNAYFHTIITKKCKYPNAALLLLGWMASPEGQKMFDTEGHRGSPLMEGTEINKMVKEAGAKVYFNSWEFTAEMAQQYSKEVIEAWGFPKARPRKK